MRAFPQAVMAITLESHHVILRGNTVDISPSKFTLLVQLARQAPPATRLLPDIQRHLAQ